jgi:murein DD-endopeptidase MepM/ murein hydrolase activator NlpD
MRQTLSDARPAKQWPCRTARSLARCREGWYVDIDHDGGIVTRYCHQLVQPYVHVGQHVNAGDVIGITGSSGHSSGPHLHFEVHLGDHSPQSAVDPVAFMASVAAPLGATGRWGTRRGRQRTDAV